MSFVDIPNFPGYQIQWETNEVKSINYWRMGKEKVLSNSSDKYGHLQVGLPFKGKFKTFRLHQLVMFIKEGMKIGNGIQVCHNDGNPLNNNPDNLRYGTYKDNSNDRRLHGRLGRKVRKFDLQGNILGDFSSIVEAEKSIGKHTKISDCCRGKRKTSQGFIWKYII